MATNSLFAWNNLAKAGIVTATSSATNLPAVNVAGDSGAFATAWQSVYGVVTGVTLQVAPLYGGQTWDVLGLFRTNLTSAATISFSLFSNSTGLVWANTLAGPITGYGQVIALPPAGTVADYAQITFNDVTNPEGVINVPMLFCGPGWRPLGSSGFASTMGRDTTTTEATSRAGQEYPSLYYQRKRWSVTLDGLRTAETWASADALNVYAAGGSNVLYIPDVTDAYVQQEAIFGRLKATADLSYPYGGADRRRWVATISERL